MKTISKKEFFETTPPANEVFVKDWIVRDEDNEEVLYAPELELYCDNDRCKGTRTFFCAKPSGDEYSIREDSDPDYNSDSGNNFFRYECRNCRDNCKTFAIGCEFNYTENEWLIFKYGENPQFGPPLPARVLRLVQSDQDLFKKGRRCENQGLGVAAYAYYRRVVENQKDRLFDEIIRVSRHLAADQTIIQDLENAKKEIQFSKAVEGIKHGVPQSIQINGHNPLTLLHNALSSGIHSLSDQECLEMATSVRLILIEFSDRLSNAMKDDAELNAAVAKLSNYKQNQLLRQSFTKPRSGNDESKTKDNERSGPGDKDANLEVRPEDI